MCNLLALAECSGAERCQEGPDRRDIRFLCATFDSCLRADSAWAGRGSRADCGGRAFHFGATRARAGRAFTALGLYVCASINYNRLLLRDGCLQHILGKVGDGRALCLEHVISHIGHCRTGRNTRLQYIL